MPLTDVRQLTRDLELARAIVEGRHFLTFDGLRVIDMQDARRLADTLLELNKELELMREWLKK